jgi:DNA mismatch endonuclease (patch repair protein)
MAGIRAKDTKPEKRVRSAMFRAGYRFRLHDGALPGTPDVVLKRARVAVFVHGCFWHRHAGCRQAYTPKTRVAFWRKKFAANTERDHRQVKELKRLGWRVVIFWECETEDESKLIRLVRQRLKVATRSGIERRPWARPGGGKDEPSSRR